MAQAASGVKRDALSARRYCNVAIPHARLHELTYEFDSERFPDLAPGACVQIRLRGKRVKGLVLEVVARSPVLKTLTVEKLVEPRLLPDQLLHLLRWVGAYYFGRMGEVLGLALPRGICGYGLRRTGRAKVAEARPASLVPAVSDVQPSSFVFPLSFSVQVQVGSSSREDAVADFIVQGIERGTVIALMPESETGAWTDRLRSRLGIEPVLYHGDQTGPGRKRVWRELRSAERRLVLGVRSAVFAPVSDLAGVVVLDEHNKVFKEERHPRYNARDVAIARARLADCPVLLCDPTPSAETWLNLRSGQYQILESREAKSQGENHKSEEESANTQGKSAKSQVESPKSDFVMFPLHLDISHDLPDTIVVDMRKHRDEVLAPVLVNELREAAAAGQSAALYINRRGLSRYVVCRECGSPLTCPHCAVSYVLFSGGDLCCQYCGRTDAAPEACPACGSPDFRFRVPGIEMAAREVSRLLPGSRVVTVVTESVQGHPPEPGSMLVGTRAILAAPWPERVKVVAALSVDADLCLPDFRAGEGTFQVLSAFSRRAAEHGATFVVQTRRPDDLAVQCASTGEVARFLDRELKLREELGFPPCRRLALVEFSAGSQSKAEKRGEWLSQRLGRARGVEALGPVPARGRANVSQVLVKLDRNVRLDRLVTLTQLEADGVRVKVDIDPMETV